MTMELPKLVTKLQQRAERDRKQGKKKRIK